VCIYRIGNIGDTACAIPALRAVRNAYPQARLTLVTSPGKAGAVGARELLDGAGWIDEIVVYHAEDIATRHGRSDLLRRLRERKFDVWIELPSVRATLATLVRNMLVARAVGARWGFGWRWGWVRFATRAQTASVEFPDEVVRLLELVGEAGFIARDDDFHLDITELERRRAVNLLEQAGATATDIVAFAPGAKPAPNRWPAERFAEVAGHLAERGFAVVVLGGDSDAPLCEQIARAAGRGAISLAGKTTVRETCAVLTRATMLVCNDSGVQHLAAAVGTPCVSLFSRREFLRQWWPHGANHEVIWKRVGCHTCFVDICPYDNKCIKMISVDEVIAAADRVLNRESRATQFASAARDARNA
jgi:ADP-heptose:LPS heptosyltransferase